MKQTKIPSMQLEGNIFQKHLAYCKAGQPFRAFLNTPRSASLAAGYYRQSRLFSSVVVLSALGFRPQKFLLIAVLAKSADKVVGDHLSAAAFDHVALHIMHQFAILEQGNCR